MARARNGETGEITHTENPISTEAASRQSELGPPILAAPLCVAELGKSMRAAVTSQKHAQIWHRQEGQICDHNFVIIFVRLCKLR